MPFKIGNDNIKDIYVGNDKIGKIYVGNDLIYSAGFTPLAPYFNFTGIDANGYFEPEASYSGTPVAYAIGKLSAQYNYYEYTQETTPTTASGYKNKYVYNTSTSQWEQCTYTNDTLSPSWVVVGTTEAYTKSAIPVGYWEQKDDFRYEFYSISYMPRTNNGFNPACFDGYDFEQTYGTMQEAIDMASYLKIENVLFPTTYNNLPVTTILPKAFEGATASIGTRSYYACYGIKNITLSSSITTLYRRPTASTVLWEQMGGNYFFETCHVSENPSERSMSLENSSLSKLNSDLVNVYTNFSSGYTDDYYTGNVVLPNTVTEITFGQIFRTSTSGAEIKKLTLSGRPNFYITVKTMTNYDAINFIVFDASVSIIRMEEVPKAQASIGTASGLVFLHGANDELHIDGLTKQKSATAITIYNTSNSALRNIQWADLNYTVTWKTLEQYEEDSA